MALYLLAHVALRLRIGGLGRGRPIAAVVLVALLPAATHLPAAGALDIAAAVCVALIAYEVLRYREQRAAIRARRESLNAEDIPDPRAHDETRNTPPGESSTDQRRNVWSALAPLLGLAQ